MAENDKPGGGPTAPQGLAGGPGPSPPGVDDGMPKVATEGSDAPPVAVPGGEEPGERAARRSEAGAARADPEEPDPS